MNDKSAPRSPYADELVAFGRALRAKRVSLGLDVDETAARAGLEPAVYVSLEAGMPLRDDDAPVSREQWFADQEALRRLGRNVLAMREQAGLTAEELAARVGLVSDVLVGIEAGDVDPGLWLIHEIESALGCEDWELLRGVAA